MYLAGMSCLRLKVRSYIIACSRKKLLLMVLVSEGVALILAFSLAHLFEINLFPLSEEIFRDLLLGTLYAMFPLGLFVLLLLGNTEKVPIIGPFRRVVVTDIKDIFSTSRLWDLFLFAVLSGFAEELLFRGVIQVKLGLIAASIIFGLLHFITPAYFIIATIIGFYLGALYQHYGSLLVPIQVHFFYNFCALIYLKYFINTQPYALNHPDDKL